MPDLLEDSIEIKQCLECLKYKPTSEFWRNKTRSDGLVDKCVTCYAKEKRGFYEKNKERLRLEKAEYVASHQNEIRAKDVVRSRFRRMGAIGLSEKEYVDALASQNNACAICGGSLAKPRIDHDHLTGKFRGLLCNPCNVGLGLFKDTPHLLVKAANYVTAHRS